MSKINRLPPLNSLRVFNAVMKHGSFRRAATELSVSPQAVSQQIQLLEDNLQVSLFKRRGRVIEPTEQAKILSYFVQSGFDEFYEGVRRVTRVQQRNRININVSPYFASHFLMPRLHAFRERAENIDIRLTTMVRVQDFNIDDIDVAIQWGFEDGSDWVVDGRRDWQKYEPRLLVKDPKILCCIPKIAENIHSPSELLSQTLLCPALSKNLWKKVMRYLGTELPMNIISEVEFQDAETLYHATMSGMGVGLVSKPDALAAIEAGKLVAPLGVDALVGMADSEVPGFYLLTPQSRLHIDFIAEFYEWICSEDWAHLAVGFE
ncbi:LysR family transcriptional regulator [Psychrobacter aestuarii]|uniref:LysR substrate-binding domain-containing protein n=1 Tax=Psychrobacter aestuarii TaxID=556327 RepID=A0ABP3FD33_9GAMM|nr:LysR family transcriptional regulator [Psychrobacter aestuarii]